MARLTYLITSPLGFGALRGAFCKNHSVGGPPLGSQVIAPVIPENRDVGEGRMGRVCWGQGLSEHRMEWPFCRTLWVLSQGQA